MKAQSKRKAVAEQGRDEPRLEAAHANHARQTLASFKLFRALDANAIREVDRQCVWRHYDRNEWITTASEENTDVIFVLSGSVSLKNGSDAGREVLFREIAAGDFSGAVNAIDGRPRTTGLMAVTETIVARMPAAVFRNVIQSHPDINEQVMARLTDRIRRLAIRINEFATLDVRHRIYAELLRLSHARPGEENRAIISPPPTQAAVAARISARREAVAREMKSLERAGLLKRERGALVITDTKRLQCMIERVGQED